MKVHIISSGGTRLLYQDLTTQIVEFMSEQLQDGETVAIVPASKGRRTVSADLNMIREYAQKDLH